MRRVVLAEHLYYLYMAIGWMVVFNVYKSLRAASTSAPASNGTSADGGPVAGGGDNVTVKVRPNAEAGEERPGDTVQMADPRSETGIEKVHRNGRDKWVNVEEGQVP